jgi:protein-disulfide isomerase/rhodanese-related sulfurtransferase
MPLFGVVGYLLLALTVVAESLLAPRLAKLARYALLGMTAFGFLLSVYLEYLQAFVIHAYCAWCIASGVVMTALLGLAAVAVARPGAEPTPQQQLARLRVLFVVAVAALVIGIPAFRELARHYDAVPAASAPAAPADLTARLLRPGVHESGNPQAALTVVEFGDFECPVCGRGEAAAREIRQRYAQRVRFVFRQFPLEGIHPFARKAAEASECAAAQGRFWEMVEAIYAHQDDLSVPGLERAAAAAGLERTRFRACLDSGETAARVQQDRDDGRALGVRATPTFFIGQERVEGVLTAEQFAQLIDAQLGAAPTPAAATPQSPAPAVPAAAKKSAPAVQPASAAAQPKASVLRPAAAEPAHPAFGLSASAPSPLAPAPAAPGNPFFAAAPAGAACNEAEATKRQPDLIGTPELRRLLTNGAKPLFVDVRPAAEFAAAHIPGAMNLPADSVTQRLASLPKDRLLVLYESGKSSGDICAAGRASGRTLLEHGFDFPNVKVYQDGLAGWNRAGIELHQ